MGKKRKEKNEKKRNKRKSQGESISGRLAAATSDGGASGAPGAAKKLMAALAFGGLTLGAAALGRRASRKKLWYASLLKSKATPPSWVFGPVWSALYSSIAYSGYRTWSQPASRSRTNALRLWALQMALNASWSPLFFGAHRPKASAAVVGTMVPAIAGYALAARKVDKPAAALVLPYLGWTGFAAYLNSQIVRRNAFRL